MYLRNVSHRWQSQLCLLGVQALESSRHDCAVLRRKLECVTEESRQAKEQLVLTREELDTQQETLTELKVRIEDEPPNLQVLHHLCEVSVPRSSSISPVSQVRLAGCHPAC